MQYAGGLEQRSTDIESGAGRPAAALVADVRATNAALESAWAAMSDAGWQGQGRTVFELVPARELPFRRWRETVLHHSDLGLGYTWHDWPTDYVRLETPRMVMLWDSRRPMGMTGLPEAARVAEDRLRLAWLMGRAEIEGLPPSGLMA
jgi:maleylpyruvate isomerase